MKVVINKSHGGFRISQEAADMLPGKNWDSLCLDVDPKTRSDLDLISVVESLGAKSWGQDAELKIVDVPDDVKWHIEEYDGLEHVAQDHKRWG
ncbi:MAG TPA: hypothetical protein VMV58_03250 [Desulfosporosinus sp.]|nr:hypothetical protein [Desulfosporosinus sp.]